MNRNLAIFVLISIFCFSTKVIAGTNLIDNILGYQRIGDVSLSPDGKQIAYTASQITSVPSGKKRYYYLFLQDKSGKINQLLRSESISHPLWSPDGNFLLYLVKQDKKQELILLNLKTKKTIVIISGSDKNISSYKWSPNSKQIALVADDEKKKQGNLLTSTQYENDYQNARIYILSPTKNATPIALTSNKMSITQSFIPSLDGGFDWSPDGKTIAFAYQERAGADYAHRSKIMLIDVASHQVKEIPYLKDNYGYQPVYSPDGNWIAFHSNLSNEKLLFLTDSYNNGQICVTNTHELSTHCLANTFNENPSIIGWSANNKFVYVFDWYKAIGPQIYALSLDSHIQPKLISDTHGFIEPLTFAFNYNKDYFAFGFEKIDQPPQIFKTKTSRFELEQITHIQNNLPKKLGSAETFHWHSKDNLEIEGILIKPANYDPKKKYPLLVSIHGGPSGAWALRYLGGCDEYGDMILPACAQGVLDLGFIILQPNYRGSSGYGKAFRSANVGDFGGNDYQDIMTGVDELIKQNVVDSDHLAIYGWSYGGYMTNWSITQTNRFKAAVAGAGLTDFISFEGTTDIPYYLRFYLNSALWDNSSLYLKRSPVLYSKQVTTPLLLLHGNEDVRVPITQAYEFYNLLKQQNKSVELIVYPEQGHILTDGNLIYESQIQANNWFKRAL